MASSPRASKAKGSLYERAVADYLRETGLFPSAERAPRWGSVDRGDLVNTTPFTFELKAVREIDLAKFVGEADIEAHNANEDYGIVVIKRRMRPVSDSYVVQPLDNWVEMVRPLVSTA